jgi:putative heme-binding domain-containing protein
VNAALSLACVFASLLAMAPAENELGQGRTLFLAHCARCHGASGAGGEGPPLDVPVLRRAADDAALSAVIRDGVAAGGMPGFWQLNEREVTRVAAYVRSLASVERVAVPGDPQRGRAIYAELGCESCHIAGGAGRGVGPELSAIGARRAPAHLRDSLLRPASAIARDFELFEATLGDGVTRVQGIRLNEDSFTIQLRDANGRLHSLDKLELRGLRRLAGQTWMQPARLDPGALDDLVAYLVSLEGRP